MKAMIRGCCLAGLLVLAAPVIARTWRVDAMRSTLAFTALCQGARTEGRFGRFTADVAYDPRDVARSRFAVRVDVASLDTGNAQRDQATLGARALDAGRFPRAYFTTTELRAVGGEVTALGELKLRGVVRPVVLQVRFVPRGAAATLEVTARLSPRDFGVDCGPVQPADGATVHARLLLDPVP
ncbi:MAG TPA: YceI family protein [Rhodanobacteraceae bacterium]|nr:YceI family protein [Rhodanobacteraceae bacterium]